MFNLENFSLPLPSSVYQKVWKYIIYRLYINWIIIVFTELNQHLILTVGSLIIFNKESCNSAHYRNSGPLISKKFMNCWNHLIFFLSSINLIQTMKWEITSGILEVELQTIHQWVAIFIKRAKKIASDLSCGFRALVSCVRSLPPLL